ncbi:MAG: Do family serine endopeptidase [Bacteroidales bacterium]|nr:Do family serine endopeptidase [Bacteroidales bacterium]
METKKSLGLLAVMVAVSGLTAIGTYKVMEPHTVQQLSDNLTLQGDSNSHLVQFSPTVSRASVTDNDFTQAAEKTVNAVVGVKNVQIVQQQYQNMDPLFDFFFGNRGYGQQQMPQQKAREGYGSGVIISSDGYIVTNNHVIANASQLTVTLNDQRQFEATLVGTDPTTDIALLKVDAQDLPTIAFGESDNLKVGEWVLAVGNPFMLNSTVTAGIVSAKARQIGMGQRSNNGQMNIESFIQTDAAVNPGNSGGALVNTAGELVGINTAIYSETGNYAGYSFAVPSSIVNKVVADLRQYGQVQRAVLGIHIQEINPTLTEEKELKETEGIYVADVIEGGAADDAGIKAGDVITSINKVRIKNFGILQGELARHTPGEKVQVTVDRKGDIKTFTVTLKNSDGNTEMQTKKGIDSLGAKFQTLTAKELQKYGVRKGVLVKSVNQGGAFARAGIHEKFVIVKINDSVVNSDKDIEAAYNELTTNRSADQDPVMFIVGVYPNGRAAYYAVDLSK